MRAVAWIGCVVLAGCSSGPYVGTAPSALHDTVRFRVSVDKLEYERGEPILFMGYLKNVGSEPRYIISDLALGLEISLVLWRDRTEVKPDLNLPPARSNPTLEMSSFLSLQPGEESRVIVVPVGGTVNGGLLEPGEYTARMSFAVPPRVASDHRAGADVAKMLKQSPRAVWESSVTFRVN